MDNPDETSEHSPIISATGPYVVTVYGPSGVGKSQVAKALAAELGDGLAARVPTDYFLEPRPGTMSLAVYRARPLAWDWTLVAERLALPLGTRTATPDFDFDAFVRRAPVGGLRFEVRPVMILDAMAPYPLAHLRVRLDAPEPVRQARLVARDRRWETTVIETWDHLQGTWEAIEAAAPAPDLILDATQPIDMTVARIAGVIRRSP